MDKLFSYAHDRSGAAQMPLAIVGILELALERF